MTYFGLARKPLFADSFMRQVRAIFCQMTPTAAAPSINTWRAFHGRCAYGCNTARRRINLYVSPPLSSYTYSPLLLFPAPLPSYFLNLFSCSLLLFLAIPLFSSLIHPFSSFSSFSGLHSFPLLLLLIFFWPSFIPSSLPSYPPIPF